MERPNWSGLESLTSDLYQIMHGLQGIQEKMAKTTGVAWSNDKTIKAVVGPRGHLVDLDIDPRVFRKPDSKALSASIVSTVRLAIEDVSRKMEEFVDEAVPHARRIGQVGGFDMARLIG
ncbi:MAG: YbaB/EbfC family nucleoid-associated protein, partial [Mycobacterium sp.]|nr:YbaB/EbfC family nucleoid-associated protein [Mycobacterium sp.]